MRFERGADPSVPAIAMARACGLLEQIGAGRARGTIVDRYPASIAPRTIRLRRERMAGFLGITVPDVDVARILEALGCAVAPAVDGWQVEVPTRRVDMTREVDLYEDVARHFGFDRIPATFPLLATAPSAPDPRVGRARQIRSLMTGSGFFEAVTFGFIAEALALTCAPADDLVALANPLSETFAVLRPSALPGLLAAVAHNLRRQQRDVRLFEIGAGFSRSRGERRLLTLAWTGAAAADHWSGQPVDVDFFDVKDVVERVCQALRVVPFVEPCDDARLVAGRRAAVVANGARIGMLGLAGPALTGVHDLTDGAVYVAEIDLDAAEAAAARADVRVASLPRYPSVTRDLSVLVDEALPSATLRLTATAAAPNILARVHEFDRYQGKGIPEGRVSLSFRLTFRAPDRTLTDAEVQVATERVLHALQASHGAVQR